MAIYIKENGKREKLKVKVLLLRKIVQFILVNGKMINSTVKEKKCGNQEQ